jgi:hypothetical protein
MNLSPEELDAMEQAVQKLAADKHHGVHSAWIGERDGKPVIECRVRKKLPLNHMTMQQILPRHFSNDDIPDSQGGRIRIHVEESAQPTGGALALASPSSAEQMQRCHDFPLKGGVQIAPKGAGWVGTLGCACKKGGDFGLLTNYHVAVGGEYKRGDSVCQPHGSSAAFARLTDWVQINFDNSPNRVDAAFCTSQDPEAKTFGVKPDQHDIGRINPDFIREPNIGHMVTKTGRTTGNTSGKVVGIRSTQYVNYGPEGTARFDGQFVVRADSGQFSAAGDSGSLVLAGDNQPIGLLFAGGGQDTICNPIRFVVEDLGIEFF